MENIEKEMNIGLEEEILEMLKKKRKEWIIKMVSKINGISNLISFNDIKNNKIYKHPFGKEMAGWINRGAKVIFNCVMCKKQYEKGYKTINENPYCETCGEEQRILKKKQTYSKSLKKNNDNINKILEKVKFEDIIEINNVPIKDVNYDDIFQKHKMLIKCFNCKKKNRLILIERLFTHDYYGCVSCSRSANKKIQEINPVVLKNIVKIDNSKLIFKCDIDNCCETFETERGLNTHKAIKHKIRVEYKCELCNDGKIWKNKTALKEHQQYVHNINPNEFICEYCKENDIDKIFKSKRALIKHQECVHKINNKEFICQICVDNNIKTKPFTRKYILEQHMAFMHGINAKEISCELCKENGIITTFLRKGELNKHMERVHDIGKYTCDFCFSDRNSCIDYQDNIGSHKICRACYKKVTGKNSRIELIWSDYIDEKITKNYLSSTDKSLKSLDGCQMFRPDKLYIGLDFIQLLECDEHQHKAKNGSYDCEEKRITDIYTDEDGICGKDLVVIRWNPHGYECPDGYKKKNRDERLDMMVKIINITRKIKRKDKIHIYYMFYDDDNPKLSKNIPYTLIYDENDLEKL